MKAKQIYIFDIVNVIMLSLFSIIALYPFWYALTVSFATNREFLTNKLLIIPHEITLNAYKYVLSEKTITNGFFIGIIRVVATTLLGLAITTLVSYPLSKKKLRGRNILFIFLVIPMLFSGGLIPSYLLIRSLHMIDTIWVLIIPGCFSVFNVILMKNYFNTIPESLIESARIEGANEFIILLKIVVPVSMPIIATLSLFTGVGVWNDFFTPMIFITKKSLYPIVNTLRAMLIDNDLDFIGKAAVKNESYMSDTSIKMAAIVVSIIPVVIVYPLLQRYFVKGIMIGSVKS